jgi:hypothetical protein
MNCEYLPTPASDGTGGFDTVEEALQAIHTIRFPELRRPFQHAFKQLIELVEHTIRVKKVKGRSMTGPVFAEFLQLAVDCINASEIIYLNQVFARSVEMVAANTVKECWVYYRREMEAYINKFSDATPISESALRLHDSRIVDSCLAKLRRRVGTEEVDIYEDFKARFLELKAKKFQDHLKHNAKNIQVMNESMGKEFWIERFGAMKLDFASLGYKSKEDLVKEVADFKQELQEEVFDCNNFNDFYSDFLSNVIHYDVVEVSFDAHLAIFETERVKKEATEVKRRVQELEQKERDVQEAVDVLISEHKVSKKMLEAEKARALKESEMHKKELDALKLAMSSRPASSNYFPLTPASSSTMLPTPPATPTRYTPNTFIDNSPKSIPSTPPQSKLLF